MGLVFLQLKYFVCNFYLKIKILNESFETKPNILYTESRSGGFEISSILTLKMFIKLTGRLIVIDEILC